MESRPARAKERGGWAAPACSLSRDGLAGGYGHHPQVPVASCTLCPLASSDGSPSRSEALPRLLRHPRSRPSGGSLPAGSPRAARATLVWMTCSHEAAQEAELLVAAAAAS